MNRIPQTFEEACAAIGVPSDRVGLVKRNVELKAKCKQRGELLMSIARTLHVHAHGGDFATCDKSCKNIREVLAETDPEKGKP